MHGAVVRGDLNNIKIGAFSTVQENCVIHAARCASQLPSARHGVALDASQAPLAPVVHDNVQPLMGRRQDRSWLDAC